MRRQIVLAITGGSGAIYAARLLNVLLASPFDVHLVISPAGKAVLKTELDVDIDLKKFDPASLLMSPARLFGDAASRSSSAPSDAGTTPGKIKYHHYEDLMAPIASGSFRTSGMVICPCSGGSMSAIAHGSSTNLIHRAADVHLKERRRLVLVPRETPLSAIQLDNMKRCADAGAVVLPAMPGFYHGVRSVQDLVDFIVARICDQLDIEHSLMRRWGE